MLYLPSGPVNWEPAGTPPAALKATTLADWMGAPAESVTAPLMEPRAAANVAAG